jgi:AcrR family transcriptional regulator
MQTQTRTLRARIADTGIRPILSPREIDRRQAILRAATTLMADFSPSSFSLTQFAIAIEASAATIRRHFIDMDGILTEILLRHLQALAACFGQIPPGAPDPQAACRAAYLAHTRTPLGGLTEPHLLFTRDRFRLPPEDLARLDAIHLSLGEQLGGLSPQDVLSLLDCPVLDAAEIEDLIAARALRFAERVRLAAEPPPPAPIRAARQADQPPPSPPQNWMPSPSLYATHMEMVRARAGP